MTLTPYRLPDGRIVQVDASAAKGASVITYTLADKRIVSAHRVCECGHDWWQHSRTISGTEACRYHGCGCQA